MATVFDYDIRQAQRACAARGDVGGARFYGDALSDRQLFPLTSQDLELATIEPSVSSAQVDAEVKRIHDWRRERSWRRTALRLEKARADERRRQKWNDMPFGGQISYDCVLALFNVAVILLWAGVVYVFLLFVFDTADMVCLMRSGDQRGPMCQLISTVYSVLYAM